MKFEWKDRSDRDELILELANQCLTNKVVCIRNHQIRSERFKHYDEFLLMDSNDVEAMHIQLLLNVDMEWLFGFIQRRRSDKGGVILFGNSPADVLPKGWKFEMRGVPICDEHTEANPCCVYPHIFIVKDQTVV